MPNMQNGNGTKINGTTDIAKLIMAILVIGIHAEPFKTYPMLDRLFSLLNRTCVPFFFVTSSYFYFKGNKSPLDFVKRLLLLYIIWSIIYLPFSKPLSAFHLLWFGNEHGLWYLWASVTGFIITYLLSKCLKPKTILLIGFLVLMIGILKSTWYPLIANIIRLSNIFGERSGFFYGFPYFALGYYLAHHKPIMMRNAVIGLLGSFLLLGIETVIFVIIYRTNHTILWLSLYPLTYCLFEMLRQLNIEIHRDTSLLIRRMSTLLYLCHFIFIYLFGLYDGFILYFLVTISSLSLSFIIIKLSETKALSFLKYLY